MTTVSPAASLDRNEQKKKGPSCHTRDIEKTLKERKREEGEGAGLITGQPSIPITTRVCLYREHFYFIFFFPFQFSKERRRRRAAAVCLSIGLVPYTSFSSSPPALYLFNFDWIRLDCRRLTLFLVVVVFLVDDDCDG